MSKYNYINDRSIDFQCASNVYLTDKYINTSGAIYRSRLAYVLLCLSANNI